VLGRDLVMVPKLIHPLPPSMPRTPTRSNSADDIEEEPPTPHPLTDTWMQVGRRGAQPYSTLWALVYQGPSLSARCFWLSGGQVGAQSICKMLLAEWGAGWWHSSCYCWGFGVEGSASV
jgi:hypothetical protein